MALNSGRDMYSGCAGQLDSRVFIFSVGLVDNINDPSHKLPSFNVRAIVAEPLAVDVVVDDHDQQPNEPLCFCAAVEEID